MCRLFTDIIHFVESRPLVGYFIFYLGYALFGGHHGPAHFHLRSRWTFKVVIVQQNTRQECFISRVSLFKRAALRLLWGHLDLSLWHSILWKFEAVVGRCMIEMHGVAEELGELLGLEQLEHFELHFVR